jgi:hypothetical protein
MLYEEPSSTSNNQCFESLDGRCVEVFQDSVEVALNSSITGSTELNSYNSVLPKCKPKDVTSKAVSSD